MHSLTHKYYIHQNIYNIYQGECYERKKTRNRVIDTKRSGSAISVRDRVSNKFQVYCLFEKQNLMLPLNFELDRQKCL